MTTEHLLDEIEDLKHRLAIAESFPLKVRMECRKRINANLVSLDFVSMLHDSANKALGKQKEDSDK